MVAVIAYHAARWRGERARVASTTIAALHELPPFDSPPKVSILVAAWNEAEIIERHVRSVLALRYPNKEYVLCAGGADGTLARAQRVVGSNTNAAVMEQWPSEGKQSALRRAFGRCSGEIIYLTDADCLLEDESLARLLEPLVSGQAQAATGASRPLDEQLHHPLARYQWYRDVYWHLWNGPWANGLLGRNCAVERAALTAVGGFDAPAATGTDYHLAGLLIAKGVRIANTRSVIQTRVPTSLRGYVHMWQRWTKNLLIQGPGSGRAAEAQQALVAALAGGFVIVGPAGTLVGPWIGISWTLVTWRGWLERVRHCLIALTVLNRSEGPAFFARLWVYYLADCLAAATAPLALLNTNWRTRW
jgi:hypothetical protein